VAGELGTVVFLHGFPEIWYSWRHQMLAVAAAGYRAIAPDCRGYGLSDQPPDDEEASWEDLVADVLAILDAYSVPKVGFGHRSSAQNLIQERLAVAVTICVRLFFDLRVQAFLVAKDFGAMPAYEFALQHPDRNCGVVCLGIPFSPAPGSFDAMPEGFYVLRWRVRTYPLAGPSDFAAALQLVFSCSCVPLFFFLFSFFFFCFLLQEPGRAEADFGRYDVRRVVRTIYVLFAGAEIPTAKEGQEIMDLADLTTPLPEWFTEEDLDAYAKLYEKSGFRYPLQMPYR